jgi:hypothetical protein
MAQIHYVVVFDTVSNKYSLDIDTELSRFDEGSVFIDGEGWKHSDDTDFDNETYERYEQLKTILNDFNDSVEQGEK